MGDQFAPRLGLPEQRVMLHGQTSESMALDQDFPTSIEVQLLGSDSLMQRTNMNVCTPGTNIVMEGELILDHCVNLPQNSAGDEWYTAVMEVRVTR